MHLRTARRSAAKGDMENAEEHRFGNLFGDSHHLHKSQRPAIKKMDGSIKKISTPTSYKVQPIQCMGEDIDFHPNGAQVKDARQSSVRSRLKDVSGTLAASKQIIKVLIRMWSHEDRSSSGLTLTSALKAEIDRAKHQVDLLISEKRGVCEEMEALLAQFAHEKAAWRREEHGRISRAAAALVEEVAAERKMRLQAERLNRRLGRELADVRAELKEIEGGRSGEEMEKIRREIEGFLGVKEGKCSGDGDGEVEEDDDWSGDGVFKGRRSICEKIQWESICLRKKGRNGVA